MTSAPPLRIALPTSSSLPTRGGAEIGLHNIAVKLLERGHCPVLITSFRHARALKAQGWHLPYEVVSYPPRLLTWRARGRQFSNALLGAFHGWLQRRYRFDVWHATVGFPVGAAVVEFCRPRIIPHLVRCIGEDIQVHSGIGYGMRLDQKIDAEIRHWLPRAQRLVAITESVAREYEVIGVDPARILRIPNGVDLPRFLEHRPKLDLRRELGIPADAVVFLALGRFHPKKNFAQVVVAARDLAARPEHAGRPFRVVIAGTGTGQLVNAVSENDAANLVYLYEPQRTVARDYDVRLPDDEILDLYAAADVFVMPSLIETFGIVTIEAMAAGLPVIAANSPGCRDVIDGGRFGRLYDGGTDGLTAAMAEMLNSDTRMVWCAKSRERVCDFDWTTVVDRYIAAYRRMIEHA
ncbi:MAG: glycosyltransferase family 4 protein [Thermodesulfobacteriota bacterium]